MAAVAAIAVLDQRHLLLLLLLPLLLRCTSFARCTAALARQSSHDAVRSGAGALQPVAALMLRPCTARSQGQRSAVRAGRLKYLF
eukprot:COSAG05_NODE_2434_length_3069_cov_2.536364_3_plen_85_part_00